MRRFRKYKVRKMLAYSLVALMLVFTFSCFREYYKVRQSDTQEFPDQANTQFRGKYFIIHQNDLAFHFENLVVGEKAIKGRLAPLAWNHQFYQTTEMGKANRYRGVNEKQVLDEVHIWLRPSPQLLPGEEADKGITIPNEMIHEIQVYDPATGTTIASHAIGVIGIAGAITGITFAIILISFSSEGGFSGTSSCPYVYVFDGTLYNLIGETFPGALLPNLERDDYLPLPGIQPVADHYQIRLANELMENQYMDLTELLVVNHPAEEKVLLDQSGQPHSIVQPAPPRWARSSTGRDLGPAVTTKDQIPFFFDDRKDHTSAVTLAFAKPAGADFARLVLRAKNTYWLDLLWYDFTKKYGSWYDDWMADNRAAPTEEIEAWMTNQHLPLSISVKTDGGWEKVADLPTVGPIAARDLVVPVDLRKHTGEEVRLRVESGFLFWELDYAAMDFSEDRPLALQVLKPSEVMVDGMDKRLELIADDGSYLHQPPQSAPVTLHFPAIKTRPGEAQSVFLKSNGYYEPVRDFTGFPDVLTLWNFDEEGRFSDFSKKQFERFLETMDITIEPEASSGIE
jgi:hypothetical protein